MSLTKSTVYSTQQILNQLFDAGANTLTISTSEGGTTTVAVAAGTAADTVVKAAPGRLCRILVTTTGTNPLQVFDNATVGSGTVIGCLPASPAVGTTYTFNFPASAGMTVKGSATNPGVTISYSWEGTWSRITPPSLPPEPRWLASVGHSLVAAQACLSRATPPAP